MGKRGPKAVHIESLTNEAIQWAGFLYTLRDGQPGLLEQVVWEPSKTARLGGKKVPIREATRIIRAKIVPVGKAALDELPSEMRTQGWVLFPPTLPDPRGWEQLKQARSVKEVRQAARSIRKWERKFGPIVVWQELPNTIRSHAREILRAKKLHNYPKTNRPRSDDKRIQFFAKVLAGLTLGIAPATATKRLGGWRWSKDWVEKGSRELIERMKAQKGETK